jgi:hypothetical protein
MTKRAVVVGINDYSGIDASGNSNLNSCVSDATDMYYMLVNAFGFDPKDMYYYADKNASSSNIIQALTYVLKIAEAGDVVCLYYSGHGNRYPETPGQLNSDRYYEGIIPASGPAITDFDLYALADTLNPSFVNFNVILDSCFSGGMQLQDSLIKCRSLPEEQAYITAAVNSLHTIIPMGVCIPPSSDVMNNNVSNLRVGSDGMIDLDIDPNKTLVQFSKSTLISASNFYELSWEVAGTGSTAGHGLMTQSFLDIVNASNFSITYEQLIPKVQSKVADKLAALNLAAGITQTPQLMGQLNRMEEEFLAGWTDSR